MTLDHDNLYSTKYVFSRLYKEAKQYNLDIIGFSAIFAGVEVKNVSEFDFLSCFETAVIKKPYVGGRFLGVDGKNRSDVCLWLCFVEKELFVCAINELGDECVNGNIGSRGGSILLFVLSGNAGGFETFKKNVLCCFELA